MKIETPTTCEVRLVIRLLRAKNVRLAEIHSQIDNEQRKCKEMASVVQRRLD
jgi:hypothetical protein